MKKTTFTLFILGLPILVYAKDCGVSNLVNGMDVEIPCVVVNGGPFTAALLNYPQGELSWQWNGQLEPITCDDKAFVCVTVNDKMDLIFPAVNISGVTYTARLNYAPELGKFNWRYHSHTVKDSQNDTQTTQLSESSLQTLRNYMTNLVDSGQIPGAVLAIATGNKTAFLEAFGKRDIDKGTAMTTDTLFHIGSTNKMVTSFLLATLVDEGVLNWDTKAQDIYPKFVLANAEYASQITIRQLLDMTSGLSGESDDVVLDVPTRSVLEGLEKFELIDAPGKQYEYSNVSVSVAAYLAVLAQLKATSKGEIREDDLNNLHANYARLLRERVLQPLKMTNSYLYINEARATGKMASSHSLNDDGTFKVSESVDAQIDNLAPAGGLKSTAGDMLRYMITEATRGLTPEGVRLVSEANMVVRQTLSPGPASQNEYGLCLEIRTLKNGLRYIGHSGSYDDFNSVMGFFPERQVAFVLLINGDSPIIVDDLTDSGILNKMAEVLMQTN